MPANRIKANTCTPQQWAILEHLRANPTATNQDIASALGLSANTVNHYLTAIYKRYELKGHGARITLLDVLRRTKK